MPLVSKFHPLSSNETIVSCLTSNFWDRFPKVTLIYELHHGDTSVFGPILASHLLTATHVGSQVTACKEHHFYFLSCLLRPPHLMRISEPSSRRKIISFACIWHIIASGLALTSHVVKSIHTWLSWHLSESHLDLRASAVIYPMHVLVCLRASCSFHTVRMTFRTLSIIPTWGTACATAISLPY